MPLASYVCGIGQEGRVDMEDDSMTRRMFDDREDVR